MSTPSRWYVCDSRMCVSACAFPPRWYACVYMCVCVRVCACRLCVCVFACCFCSRTCGFCSFSSTSTLSSRTYHVCMCVYVCVHVCVAYKHVFVHVHTHRETHTHTHGHTHTHNMHDRASRTWRSCCGCQPWGSQCSISTTTSWYTHAHTK